MAQKLRDDEKEIKKRLKKHTGNDKQQMNIL